MNIWINLSDSNILELTSKNLKTMKKMLFLLLAFAVAGATMSCEKEYLPGGNNNDNNVEIPLPGDSNAEEADKFVGCWVSHNAEGTNKVLTLTYRFYEKGKGYKTSDSYTNGKVGGFGREPMTYWVENDVLYILNAHDEKPLEWSYKFEGNNLTLTNKELECEFNFFKKDDASKKFMGSWERVEKIGDEYYLYIIKMVTPTDGYTQNMKYNNLNSPAIYMSDNRWFKYSFDGVALTMTEIGSDTMGREVIRYYTMSGAELYLSKSYQGEANCYTEFYRDNGLEFQP